jgi:abequosyltransferase
MIRLSICIPTYNFGKFIGETLDSILPQLSAEVEVIILDGGSVDNTATEVAAKKEKCNSIAYHLQDYRGGIDRDIEKVVSLARGQYCWLFSADDIMQPDSIPKILEAIKTNYDVYLCEHLLCDFNMRPLREYPPLHSVLTPRLFDFSDENQRQTYFRLARTSEAFFSFMSSPVFKRTVWDAAKIPESFRGTCWIVAGHLLSMASNEFTIYYLAEKLLKKRGDNDSFADQGMVNRSRIAIEMFQHVSNTIFGEQSQEAFHIRRVLQQDIPLSYLMLAKLATAENPALEDIALLNRITKMHYSDKTLNNLGKHALYKATPTPLVKFVYWLKTLMRKKNVQ